MRAVLEHFQEHGLKTGNRPNVTSSELKLVI